MSENYNLVQDHIENKRMVLDVKKNCFIEPYQIQNKLVSIFQDIWNTK